MFKTNGTYNSVYEFEGRHIHDSIAFFPTLDGGEVGIGGVDSDNWRMFLHVDKFGSVTYEEINATTYKLEDNGSARLEQTYPGIFIGEWYSKSHENGDILSGPWTLVHAVGSTSVEHS